MYLKNEYNIFKRKEKLLKQREQRLRQQSEELISLTTTSSTLNNQQPITTVTTTQADSKQKFEAIKAKYDQQLELIRDEIKLKMKENKRLYHAFKSIRETNESLKLKVGGLIKRFFL